MDQESGTPRETENHVNKNLKFVWGKLAPQEIMQKWFSDGQGNNKSEKSLKFFWRETGPSGNHAKMIFRWSGQTQISEVCKVFFCWKITPRQIMKNQLFGHPLNPRALGTAPVEKSAKF